MRQTANSRIVLPSLPVGMITIMCDLLQPMCGAGASRWHPKDDFIARQTFFPDISSDFLSPSPQSSQRPE